ncbi:neuronal acetylcholine receptor subunit alpha-7-like [Crassostrea angulata]|uniref:neuronal acetylcholine receptor subunit alpha-7-like n=1 Tax=Magallana angulata TaxID=2784310 RepID=UPI0022B142C7|nr:neuronal acetylcholine receptor subunit alpha-7-like [Crassostrea angulata]
MISRKPVKVFSKTVPVEINLYILSLKELDMKSQILHIASWLEVKWTDEHLSWNSSEFSNIKYLRLPADKVWVPAVCNLQEISGKKCLTYGSVKNTGSEVGVESSGLVTLAETIESIVSCSFNVQKFPFDTQTCKLNFFSPNSYLQNTNLLYNQTSFQSGYYIPNEEWDLVSTIVEGDTEYNLYLVITFRRRPLFPTFCFLLPTESGEKMGMSMAIFLTFAVFGSMISSSMPKNSEHITWFSVYVTTQIILSGFSVIMETAVLHMHYKDVVLS